MGAGALLDEPRIFMDGLSDESGAAAPLAMAIKQLGAPVASEVAQLEAYVHETLWTPEHGDRRQFLQGRDYAVRASMVYWSDNLTNFRRRPRGRVPSLGNEREFHHYGSTLNAVAVLDAYRAYPGWGHLLRLGAVALL